MKVNSEAEMLALGRLFAEQITLPAVFELIGDVGTGKTTFTRGLAEGLGVAEPLTSPSFTISKRYGFWRTKGQASGELIHYDFYRLPDPGIMYEELAEALGTPNHVIVVEWGSDVAELLPEDKYQLKIQLCEDGSREIITNFSAHPVEELWKTQQKLCKTCGKDVDKTQDTVENPKSSVDNSNKTVEKDKTVVEKRGA